MPQGQRIFDKDGGGCVWLLQIKKQLLSPAAMSNK